MMSLQHADRNPLNRRNVAQLFRGRPYTKAIPFSVVLTGIAGQFWTLWQPNGHHFELALIISRATVAMDLLLADTIASAICGRLSPDAVGYQNGTLDLGQAGFRSAGYVNAKLLLVDGGVAGTVNGIVYGWEVTPDGDYN